ncbi:MAG: glycosyltransferase family 2 protein [Lachnospiraceae bacterium]|nr:glycosyltransferase family 2 protein [Lachnospiraceae bacterium]
MSMLSVVIPSYNERDNIKETISVLADVLSKADIEYELIFVSDGSDDGTFDVIRDAAAKDGRIKGLEFSRNFGKEAGIFAGLSAAGGDAVIVMDCDLQHPPEVIPEMWKEWQNGAMVVEGIKTDRGKESVLHRLFAGLFYKLMSALIGMDMSASSDFKLLDKRVAEVLLELPERNTFFRALSFWVGFETKKVYYEVADRKHGKSKWSYRGLVSYAIRNATSFSTLPLQAVTYIGTITIILSVILGIQTLARYLSGNAATGFTTVILLILLVGGLLMVSLGIIGHYLARIYEEVKGRPRYIISKTVGDVPEIKFIRR